MQNKLQQIKKSKLFKPFDIIIYSFATLLILSLFFIFIILPNKKNSAGFEVRINNDLAFSYLYGKDLYVNNNFSDKYILQYNDDTMYLTIYFDDSKEEYNTLKIDDESKTVCIIEASCENKDCIRFSPISNKGSIICLPHKLIISPTQKVFNDLVIGG